MSNIYDSASTTTNCLGVYWSCIWSFLGPHKSIKVVVKENNDDRTIVSCATEYLRQTSFQHPVSELLCCSLDSYHDAYGCGTTSMLTMVYFWHRSIVKLQQEEDIHIQKCIPEMEVCLETVIALLDTITISLRCEVLKNAQQTTPNRRQMPDSSLSSLTSNLSSLRTSRHFDQISNELSDSITLSNGAVASLVAIESAIVKILRKLSHGQTIASDLLTKAFKMQFQQNKIVRNSVDGILRFDLKTLITICSLSATSNSDIFCGLLLKVRCDALDTLSCFLNRGLQALLIKGNVTSTFLHKGVNLTIQIDTYKKLDEEQPSEKISWISKVYGILKQLAINVLIVSGKVGDDLVLHLHSKGILVLDYVGGSTLDIIAHVTGSAAASYITDCDELNVACGLSITTEDCLHVLACKNYSYVHLHFPEAFQPSIQTVIICHPVDDYAVCLEHSFWHVAHRFANVIKYGLMLPGNGDTEEFISKLDCPVTVAETPKYTAWRIVLAGFKDFSETIKRKLIDSSSIVEISGDEDFANSEKTVLDDFTSKIESWRAALRLACIISQTDFLILTGRSEECNSQANQQLWLGNL